MSAGAGDLLYLDHNATTPVAEEVVAVVVDALRTAWGNPASDHPIGRAAAQVLERARAEVAATIGAEPDEIVFTSGGTEADNLAVHGVAGAIDGPGPGRRIAVTSPIEHPAISGPLGALEALDGWRIEVLPTSADGVVQVPERVPDGTALLTVMLANNETGVLQPVRALAERARAAGAVVHTDAAQAVGKVPVDVEALGVDLLTIAGHKLYAPKGVGALYVRRGTPLRPMLRGGGQQRGLRPGTDAVSQAAGLGEACRIARERLATESVRQQVLRDQLAESLKGRVPGLRVTGEAVERLPNTLHVRFPGVSGAAVLARAPSVAASTGSACHAGIESASAVLLAMGLAPDDALGAVRLSLGRGTTAAVVQRAVEVLVAAWTEAIGG
jgi:cysteine desulfurase